TADRGPGAESPRMSRNHRLTCVVHRQDECMRSGSVCTGAVGIAAGTMVLFPAVASAGPDDPPVARYEDGMCGNGNGVVDHKNLPNMDGTVFLTRKGGADSD